MHTLKSNDYHGLTISDNKTPNMTTLDKTRNMLTAKNGKYNYNNIISDKAILQGNNTIAYYNNKPESHI
jgi:hypothetical protein